MIGQDYRASVDGRHGFSAYHAFGLRRGICVVEPPPFAKATAGTEAQLYIRFYVVGCKRCGGDLSELKQIKVNPDASSGSGNVVGIAMTRAGDKVAPHDLARQ